METRHKFMAILGLCFLGFLSWKSYKYWESTQPYNVWKLGDCFYSKYYTTMDFEEPPHIHCIKKVNKESFVSCQGDNPDFDRWYACQFPYFWDRVEKMVRIQCPKSCLKGEQ